MKYVILLGDGMGDYPLKALAGRTPLEAAHTPHMDFLANHRVGLLQTIPTGMPAGSDVAILSILGYDPAQCYPGRGPLEAAVKGIELGADDIAFRCNLVTLAALSSEPIMEDFTAGHITSWEAAEIIATLAEHFQKSEFEFYSGVGYRHLCIWRNGRDALRTTPPHDIISKPIAEYLPQGRAAATICEIMSQSQELLIPHPINNARRQAGKKIANSIWLWGQGRAPRITPLTERYSLTGAVISAVDLLNGAGKYAGLETIAVEGATGYIDTNYAGKAQAALEALQKGKDFILLHVEAPDEMGHEGNWQGKIKAIEDFDEKIVGVILKKLNEMGNFRLLVLSDHLTPIALKTHSAEATPFAFFSSNPEENRRSCLPFSERAARESGLLIDPGHLFLEMFIDGKFTD